MADFGGGGFAVALVGAGVGGDVEADIAGAVALAGGRIGERVAWGAVPVNAVAVLAIEAEGVDDTTLADTLPGLAGYAEARDLAVVATIAAAQIDRVAAELLGPRTVLLCAPTLAERVAALAVAGGAANLPGVVREGEAERLWRLNGEVARIAAMLAGLVENHDGGSAVEDRRRSYGAAPAAPIDAGEVRATIRARRLRAQFFDIRLIEDPGWDMLLDLFAAELERGHVSVSSLCIAAAVAPTTGLRWITRMIAAGLFVRMPDAEDRRRAFLVLSRPASEAMRAYAGAVRRAGLTLV